MSIVLAFFLRICETPRAFNIKKLFFCANRHSLKKVSPLLALSGHSTETRRMSAFGRKADIVRDQREMAGNE
jgi:hypothetical protein